MTIYVLKAMIILGAIGLVVTDEASVPSTIAGVWAMVSMIVDITCWGWRSRIESETVNMVLFGIELLCTFLAIVAIVTTAIIAMFGGSI
ncbi:MAG TPA: hypothetical protein PKM21_16005 [Anaerolineales bacterium]|nr:hypothetical protein [Anaerolineales bacterium]